MATGLTEWSGTLAPTDVPNAGEMSWTSIAGIDPEDPRVGGPHVAGLGAGDVDRGRSRIATMADASQPWTGAGAGTPEGRRMDDWRDLFNFRGSPMPWLLLLALAALGMLQLSVAGRVGPVRAAAAAG